ncbi:hypothetical protein HPB50_002788 [Hyalomma asiaticum]|uniref:Uncharacterized protein n=1 Tax=Hyalomma asiaticum TaxID=266040 RepID=A0ACB7S4M2_HYAAI|nr:hypothetical protein HPB50_002788 [Hyalomma asiaticum]
MRTGGPHGFKKERIYSRRTEIPGGSFRRRRGHTTKPKGGRPFLISRFTRYQLSFALRLSRFILSNFSRSSSEAHLYMALAEAALLYKSASRLISASLRRRQSGPLPLESVLLSPSFPCREHYSTRLDHSFRRLSRAKETFAPFPSRSSPGIEIEERENREAPARDPDRRGKGETNSARFPQTGAKGEWGTRRRDAVASGELRRGSAGAKVSSGSETVKLRFRFSLFRNAASW